LALCAAAAAQDHQPPRIEADAPVGLELVKTGLYVVRGGGGNTAVRLSGNGIILVDGKLPGHYPELVKGVRRIADELPIRMLITTSQDQAHTGTNADFLTHGVPVVSQARTRDSLAAAGTAPPSVVFDDQRTIKLGGVTAELRYFGPAHTGGDAVVYFPDLKIVAVGDLFTRETPRVDFAAGGSLEGWVAALEGILQLDFDKVIPGTGPIADRAELQRFQSRLAAMVARDQH
jgi:glyoxylase-like metal-dependent hydrolase (beta-lactamase superfamily II)